MPISHGIPGQDVSSKYPMASPGQGMSPASYYSVLLASGCSSASVKLKESLAAVRPLWATGMFLYEGRKPRWKASNIGSLVVWGDPAVPKCTSGVQVWAEEFGIQAYLMRSEGMETPQGWGFWNQWRSREKMWLKGFPTQGAKGIHKSAQPNSQFNFRRVPFIMCSSVTLTDLKILFHPQPFLGSQGKSAEKTQLWVRRSQIWSCSH